MILLDTHTLIWWVSEPERLSTPAAQAIEGARVPGGLVVSTISCWEIALLVKRGRLDLSMSAESWTSKVARLPYINFFSIDRSLAVRSINLPGDLHADPADRLIVATALTLGIPLVTKDRRLSNYPHATTIW